MIANKLNYYSQFSGNSNNIGLDYLDQPQSINLFLPATTTNTIVQP